MFYGRFARVLHGFYRHFTRILHNRKHNAAVFSPSCLRLIVGNRVIFAKAYRRQTRLFDTFFKEIIHTRFGPLFTQFLIKCRRASAVGVALNGQF